MRAKIKESMMTAPVSFKNMMTFHKEVYDGSKDALFHEIEGQGIHNATMGATRADHFPHPEWPSITLRCTCLPGRCAGTDYPR